LTLILLAIYTILNKKRIPILILLDDFISFYLIKQIPAATKEASIIADTTGTTIATTFKPANRYIL